MNFVGHVSVALSLGNRGPEEAYAGFAFGAALPDLASMAGLRLEPPGLPEPVRQGVAFHHRTDAAFHSLVDFTTGASRLRQQLEQGGLAVGPSRAVGHAGWELLLDGCLLDRPGHADGFARVLDLAPDLALSVSPGDPDRWRGLVAGMRSDRWWLGYRDPSIVAHRLQRRLRGRRRLAFATGEIPLVAEVLADARPAVDLAAAGVVPAVIAAIEESSQAGPATTKPHS